MKKSTSASSRLAGRRRVKPGITVVDAAQAHVIAKKAPPIKSYGHVNLTDIPEVDFTVKHAVRGKYHMCFMAASGLVQLDPDIRKMFRDDASVNQTLRQVLHLTREIQRQSGRNKKPLTTR